MSRFLSQISSTFIPFFFRFILLSFQQNASSALYFSVCPGSHKQGEFTILIIFACVLIYELIICVDLLCNRQIGSCFFFNSRWRGSQPMRTIVLPYTHMRARKHVDMLICHWQKRHRLWPWHKDILRVERGRCEPRCSRSRC